MGSYEYMEYIEKELEGHYEVLCEAIQTILRKNNIKDAYEMLKELSRGKTINKSRAAFHVSSPKNS